MAILRNPLHDEQANLATISLVVLAAVAIVAALAFTRPVLVPLVVALIVYYLVSPVADFLELKLRFTRWLSTLVVMLLVGAVLSLLGLLFLTSARGLLGSADVYQVKLLDVVTTVTEWLDARGLTLSRDAIVTAVSELPTQRAMQAGAGLAVSLVQNGTLVLLFVIFLLLGRTRQLIKHPVFRQIDRDIRRYLVLKTLISLATGVMFWVILTSFGIELALVFGVVTFVLNFIPSIGSIVATLLPIPVALVQYETLGPVIALVVLMTLVQLIIGNGIDPLLMGQNLNLSPVTILAALVFWGLIWGVVGMLLAAPLTAILRIILAQFETTRPMSELLAGRLPEGDAGMTVEHPTPPQAPQAPRNAA
ncbi:AI-2E family transporter [Pseudogemmatithrix spongiicola]|uniref:AI-2E family transporter n=1 Tax=Pseudogemmatithrix spongiicola TaxID=3062599 RepID=A0AA49JTZ0_9BACT|nr:AI-2E family transporter [Gemmatimonadaceae bacterium 'strain 138']WKW14747.1 AI-2E family transporter [Gemmatimonadaceae bacterium 'strain 318']